MKKKTYTYNPEKIGEPGVDRMRFEIGDTMVEGEQETSALCNEEYEAIIAARKTWKRAKLAVLESIMRRFGMEVNTTVGPLKLEMQSRAEFWRKQYEQLKKECGADTVPTEAIIFMVVCTTMCMQKQEGASAIFYLRPGNLYKDFLVAKCTSGVDGKGRPVKKYDSDHSVVIHAVLAQATPQEKARWEQIQHPITHTIVDRGHPKAVETDQLTCGNRKFYVQGVDEPGQLGLYTIYYVEERADV